MKSKNYKFGNYNCKSYMKKVGYGYEVGFYFGEKQVFVGNFIYPQEATRWYGIMNKEIFKFSKEYSVGYKFQFNWFTNFFKNYLYNYYYAYLDKLFARYTRHYKSAFAKDFKTFKQNKKNWTYAEGKKTFLKAA